MASRKSTPSNEPGDMWGTKAGKPQVSWAQLDPEAAAKEIWRMVQLHTDTPSWRHYMALRGAAAWSGVGLGNLFQQLNPFDVPAFESRGSQRGRRRGKRSFSHGGWFTRDAEQHARAACETVNEKLMGLDQPKQQRVATDAPYEVTRQGLWADRFVEGAFHLPQFPYSDVWDLARQGALLAFAATGTVAARVEEDYVTKRVRAQLRSTLDTFIDPGDCANGMPLSYFDVSWENAEYLCADPRFTAEQRDQIWKSSEVPPQHSAGTFDGPTFGTRMVKLVGAWRMPFGDKSTPSGKGRCAWVVKFGKPIIWEDWDSPEPPLAFYRVNRCIGDSFWGENFIEIMLDPLADAEDIDDMAKQTMARTSQTHIALDGKSTSPASVLNAKDVVVHRYDSKKGQQAPVITKPGLLHADYFAWRDRKIQIAYQLAGVPMMHIASQSPEGTDSGRAKRLEASLLPERFARKLRGWRDWVAVGIGNQYVRAARRIGKEDPNWQVTWPGMDFDSKVPVKVLDIDDTAYEVSSYAVGEQKGTPSERAQYAQELFDRKQITNEQLSLILDGLYDTPKETKTASAQRRMIAKQWDDIANADPKVIADERRYMAERYETPPPWIDPPSAMAQVLPLYYNAMVDGVPQNRRNLMKRVIEDILAIQVANEKAEALRNAQQNISTGVQVEAAPGQVFPEAAGAAPAPVPGLEAPPAPAGAPAPNVGGPAGLA